MWIIWIIENLADIDANNQLQGFETNAIEYSSHFEWGWNLFIKMLFLMSQKVKEDSLIGLKVIIKYEDIEQSFIII